MTVLAAGPSGLELSLDAAQLAGFLLALGRTAGFVLTAPPFNTRSVPAQVRAMVAIGLALPMSVWTAPVAPPLDSPELVLQEVLQVVTGVALGFLVLVAVATLQVVGDIIDNVGGFTMSMAMDPLMLTQNSVMGRLHQMVAVTLLMAADGHLVVVQGLARSLQLMPLPALSSGALARAATADVAATLLAAVQVAAPVMAAMLVADVALGLLTRAAPALNAFALGYPLKILLALLLVGLLLVQLPDVLDAVLERAARSILDLSGG